MEKSFYGFIEAFRSGKRQKSSIIYNFKVSDGQMRCHRNHQSVQVRFVPKLLAEGSIDVQNVVTHDDDGKLRSDISKSSLWFQLSQNMLATEWSEIASRGV